MLDSYPLKVNVVGSLQYIADRTGVTIPPKFVVLYNLMNKKSVNNTSDWAVQRTAWDLLLVVSGL